MSNEDNSIVERTTFELSYGQITLTRYRKLPDQDASIEIELAPAQGLPAYIVLMPDTAAVISEKMRMMALAALKDGGPDIAIMGRGRPD